MPEAEPPPESHPIFTEAYRKEAEDRLRKEYGDKWMEENKARLDAEWEHIQTL